MDIRNDGVPIYVQIREQILAAIRAGTMLPGSQLPTMRQVAVALKIDLNTVRHAYDELERNGAINLVRGRGSFVSGTPPLANQNSRLVNLESIASQFIASAKAMGVDPEALGNCIVRLAKGAKAP